MRKLALLTFVTLDGVMQAVRLPEEDRSSGFDHGGWAAPYWEAVMEQVGRTAMAEPYDMLLGRKTHDLFVTNQPQSPNDGRVYVASSKPLVSPWANAVPLVGDAAVAVAKLKNEDGPLLQVHGSQDLNQTLLAKDLVDELRLWIFPVVLGSGKRLFERGAGRSTWRLAETEPTGNGVAMAVYSKS